MAAPYIPGQAVGEPTGALASVAITRETLDIDLRPLIQDNDAAVTATYQVRQAGIAQQIDLVFVAAALASSHASNTSSAGVWLDGQRVRSAPGTAPALPPSWRPPTSTPGLNGQPAMPYPVEPGQVINFKLTLAPGAHTIAVRYPAKATVHSGDSPARYWQLGYVLAPAREWRSFGGLDVSVDLPPGWNAASLPSLERSGNTLRGSFAQIPADSLGLTVQYPPPPATGPGDLFWRVGLAAAMLIAGLIVFWLLRRRRWWDWWILPGGLMGALIWIIAYFAVGQRGAPSIPAQQVAWNYRYANDQFFTTVFSVVCVGLVITVPLALLASLRRLAGREVPPASS